jgi:glutamyl-tRNA synthetase
MGEGNKKLSKRDPESNLFHHRERGFIREGLLNYLSLLGWSIAADRDIFTLDEMIAAFDVSDVNPNPARFDVKKAESVNGDHIRLLSREAFIERTLPYLHAAGLVDATPTSHQLARLTEIAPHIQERTQLMGEIPEMVRFLFTEDRDLTVSDDARSTLDADAAQILDSATVALNSLVDWSTVNIEATLRASLIDDLGLKPRSAFGSVRTAISGRRVSPPLFESMEILGKESSLARIAALRATL